MCNSFGGIRDLLTMVMNNKLILLTAFTNNKNILLPTITKSFWVFLTANEL